MTNYLLVKMSTPSNEWEFMTMEGAAHMLRSMICDGCLNEADEDYCPCLDIDVLLSTACGCEYDIEEINND